MTFLEPGQGPDLSATCPFCGTMDKTLTSEALGAGAAWACTRCGQTWTAARLATAAAYVRNMALRVRVVEG